MGFGAIGEETLQRMLKWVVITFGVVDMKQLVFKCSKEELISLGSRQKDVRGHNPPRRGTLMMTK